MEIVRDLLHDSKPKDWIDGLQWLGWNAILGLMPIWITLLMLRFFKQQLTWSAVTANGEFALYAASFLGTCFYIVARDYKKRAYPSRGTMLIILTALLVGSVFMYVITSLVGFITNVPVANPIHQLFDREFLGTLSLVLLPVVCMMTYLSIVADNVRTTADLPAMAQENMDTLEKDFDKLGEGR